MSGGGGNGYCWVRKPETTVQDRVSTFVREKANNFIYTYIIHMCVSYSTLCSIKTKEKKKSLYCHMLNIIYTNTCPICVRYTYISQQFYRSGFNNLFLQRHISQQSPPQNNSNYFAYRESPISPFSHWLKSFYWLMRKEDKGQKKEGMKLIQDGCVSD